MVDKRNKILIASDHGGFDMKEYIKEGLNRKGYEYVDMGTFSHDSVDYPDYIHPLASEINKDESKKGIILCGSGNGAQMTANKYSNVRAALCWSKELAELARKHNNANIIALPGRFIDFELALEMVLIFLTTDFEAGRHTKRVEKISKTSRK